MLGGGLEAILAILNLPYCTYLCMLNLCDKKKCAWMRRLVLDILFLATSLSFSLMQKIFNRTSWYQTGHYSIRGSGLNTYSDLLLSTVGFPNISQLYSHKASFSPAPGSKEVNQWVMQCRPRLAEISCSPILTWLTLNRSRACWRSYRWKDWVMATGYDWLNLLFKHCQVLTERANNSYLVSSGFLFRFYLLHM